MDIVDMLDTRPPGRPRAVTLLSILQIIGGLALIFSVVAYYDDASGTLSSTGVSWISLFVAGILYGTLGIAAGIGMWRGRPWGWWLAAFVYFYGILRNVSALLMIPGMLDAFGEPAQGSSYYYVREAFQTAWNAGITVYWFSGGILDYFGLAKLSRLRAVLSLAGVSIAIFAASYLLPGTVDRDLERIAGMYEEGDVPGAIEELEQYLESDPDNDLAWILLGRASLDMYDYDSAQAAYGRAIEINPERHEAWTGLGIVNRMLGDYERALQCYEQALAIEPNNAEAYTSMSLVAVFLYDDVQALEYAQKAYDLDRRNPVVAANLAVVYHYNGMYEERDAMTAEARRLGYESTDSLQMIYDGLLDIRE